MAGVPTAGAELGVLCCSCCGQPIAGARIITKVQKNKWHQPVTQTEAVIPSVFRFFIDPPSRF
jgi:hypothetical protein